MINLEQAHQQLLADLGYKPLSRTWARLEIALGLLAVGLSVIMLFPTSVYDFEGRLIGLALFALGGYLTLAGHRSLQYQSLNNLAAYLLLQTRHNPQRTEIHEHSR